MATRPGPESAPPGDLISELVHQFSDPFAFYRELIQNSIDAGSTRIEVSLHYQPGSPGLLTACVADWGEGMSRRIVEEYLVTKFRSSKEGDLTKIGKFGIGFVSVFSCAPELVMVETGRDGEDWRVLFHPDHRYELLRAAEPLEGTRVSVLKAMGPAEYREFARRSEEAVRRWCRHSESEVCFAAGGDDGSPPPAPAPVREPLRADAPFQVEERDGGAWIVAGPARQEPPRVGFYNRGLTLLETREALLPGISFCAVSDLLEHTLTRDNVRRDAAFERLLARVAKLVRGPLAERLPGELRAAAAADPPGDDYAVLLRYAAGVLPARGLWVPLAGGGAADGATLLAAARRQGRLFHGPASPLATALRSAGVPVLAVPPEALPLLEKALGAACASAPAEFSWCAPGPDPDGPLSGELLALLRAAGGRCRALRLGRLHGAGADRLAVAAADDGSPLPAGQALRPPFDAEVLALSADSPALGSALALGQRSPRLAAYLLARLLTVGSGLLDEDRDVRLTLAALA